MSELEPKYAELQSIYDISNEFFELFAPARPTGLLEIRVPMGDGK
ncbi:hypothetical protein PP713_12610 [Mycobacterium sp. CSUR Q5927]|nr:hypothetical protein [Mycobacterium sp. CSUR Q5927]